ncbi:MAG: transcription/translation regulatory transformer protein RfaH [Gammaproteobacteria bacterium]|nr:transcription/translation regulatory transformer protein RfaH [Gammaproteobacteria bacterium]
MKPTKATQKRLWYLVYTKSRQEMVAHDNLVRQGYDVYLPMISHRRRRCGRYKIVVEPMFPRYILVQLNTVTDNWVPISSTLGVMNMVRFGVQPAFLPDDIVHKIKHNEDNSHVQELPTTAFRKDEAIRICDGPMKGCEGLYIGKTGQERAIIMLEIAGNVAKLNLSESQIEVA